MDVASRKDWSPESAPTVDHKLIVYVHIPAFGEKGYPVRSVLLALQPRVQVERGVALSPRLAVLLEKKSQTELMRGLDRRLKKLQKNIKES